eukprot:RCo047477
MRAQAERERAARLARPPVEPEDTTMENRTLTMQQIEAYRGIVEAKFGTSRSPFAEEVERTRAVLHEIEEEKEAERRRRRANFDQRMKEIHDRNAKQLEMYGAMLSPTSGDANS